MSTKLARTSTCVSRNPEQAPDSAQAASAAERIASSLYADGFHCGESVFRAVSEVAGTALPAEAARLASGFCEGLGGSRCICGALAGGVMGLGLFCGRDSADEHWEPCYYATAELRRRWVGDQQAESCEEVVSRLGEMNDPARWAHCASLVGRTARWVIEIAKEQGLAVRY